MRRAEAEIYAVSTDCIQCGVCEFMCPEGAIIEARRQFIILKQECTGCGDCVPYCPVRAIVPRHRFAERQTATVASRMSAVIGPL